MPPGASVAPVRTPVAATTWVFGTVRETSYVPKSAKNSVVADIGWHSHRSAPGAPTRTPIFGNHWATRLNSPL